MKRKPFVLIEVLICVGILALCIIPIVGYPIYSFHQRKEKLLSIEKERQAELIFFDFLKKIQSTYKWNDIGRAYTARLEEHPLSITVDGLGEVTLNMHTHLYHAHPKKNKMGIRKLHYKVCFQEECNPYEFIFFVRKKVEEKTLNDSKEE